MWPSGEIFTPRAQLQINVREKTSENVCNV